MKKFDPKLFCRYYSGAHIGYASGLAWSVRMSTRTCWFRRVDTLKYLLWSSSVLGAGYLVDGLAQFDRVLHFLFCQSTCKLGSTFRSNFAEISVFFSFSLVTGK